MSVCAMKLTIDSVLTPHTPILKCSRSYLHDHLFTAFNILMEEKSTGAII